MVHVEVFELLRVSWYHSIAQMAGLLVVSFRSDA